MDLARTSEVVIRWQQTPIIPFYVNRHQFNPLRSMKHISSSSKFTHSISSQTATEKLIHSLDKCVNTRWESAKNDDDDDSDEWNDFLILVNRSNTILSIYVYTLEYRSDGTKNASKLWHTIMLFCKTPWNSFSLTKHFVNVPTFQNIPIKFITKNVFSFFLSFRFKIHKINVNIRNCMAVIFQIQ